MEKLRNACRIASSDCDVLHLRNEMEDRGHRLLRTTARLPSISRSEQCLLHALSTALAVRAVRALASGPSLARLTLVFVLVLALVSTTRAFPVLADALVLGLVILVLVLATLALRTRAYPVEEPSLSLSLR